MKIFTKIINEETKEVLLMNQEEAKLLNLEEMEIEFAYNGKAYLLGCAPQQPLEEVKTLKKAILKDNVESFIFSIYPQTTQNNLAIYGTEEERNNFKRRKEEITSIYHSRLEEIEKAETIEELEKVELNFE